MIAGLVRRVRITARFFENVLADSETPKLARWCIIAAIGYLAAPIDLIPDFIPVVGQLDDVAVVGLLLAVAWLVTPKAVIERHR